MDIRVTIDNRALLNKENFNAAILEFTKQAIIAQMARNYVLYNKTDAFCANIIVLEDMKSNGFITEEMENELDIINRRLNMD